MIYFSILYNMFYRICWTVHSMHIVIVFLFDVKEIAVMILLIRVQVASTADYKLDSPHALELFLVGHEVFLHLIGYVISPACPGSALGSFSSWTCMKFLLSWLLSPFNQTSEGVYPDIYYILQNKISRYLNFFSWANDSLPIHREDYINILAYCPQTVTCKLLLLYTWLQWVSAKPHHLVTLTLSAPQLCQPLLNWWYYWHWFWFWGPC